ncbi:uncharacterized protein PFL1_02135 [Pseudozyma flocculosa PF-1]|uniref:Related to Myosin heavy chain n=1 Tax=Pseudozyma flocculosa TaxID=84751 RepID=A0A5C3F199_9BASI|nr:uncharacterized protein PFL1_02135 [Pseudozyma flocculosa PF-1]EPQ30611.1 hypothetical protein PFL1_02135 [Pseudozyma flocculosa PF-1]SPO37706.1 related to Myosin heavy chain [Pseudozyma flocculosa]
MANRPVALAGYDATSAYDSTTDQSTFPPPNPKGDLTGLDTEPSIQLNLPPAPALSHVTQRRKPSLARRATAGASDLPDPSARAAGDDAALQTPAQPRVSAAGAAGPSRNAVSAREPPSTQRKEDPRRRYGVRIADDDTLDDVEDSLEASGEAELRKMQADLSEGIDSMVASPHNSNNNNNNDSGQWGSRAMRRRSAAGVSMKSAQEKINGLTQERDELKIVVDLLREKVSLDDRLAELIVLKKEKLAYTNKMIAQQAMLKQQDRAIKLLHKEQQAWNGRDPVQVEQQIAELEAQLRAANTRAEDERRDRIRAEEELDFIKRRGDHTHGDASASRGMGGGGGGGGGGEAARLRDELDALKEDHADEKYELRRERDAAYEEADAMRAELERLRGQSGGAGGGADDSRASQRERGFHREIDELEQQLTAQRAQNEKMQERQAQLHAEIEAHKDEVYELRSSEEALQRELEVAKQSLEHANMTQEDDLIRFQEAEQMAAERYQEQIDKLRDSLTAAQLQIDEKEAESEKLEQELQEQVAKVADLEYELRQAETLLDEQKAQIEGVEAEADELDRQLQVYREEADTFKAELDLAAKELETKDAELAETNKEMQELSNRNMALEEGLEARGEEIKRLDEELVKVEDALQQANEKHDRHAGVLKEKLANSGLELSEAQSQLEAALNEVDAARDEADAYARDVEELTNEKARLEELVHKLDSKISDVVEDLKAEERALDDANAEWERKLDSAEERLNRIIDEKEENLASLEQELGQLERDLATSKQDVQNLQDALRAKENESFRMGQSQANDKYSLELEIDRLKRDLARCEADLERARKEIDRKDDALREKEDALARLQDEQRELAGKLASETQGRMGLNERFEAQQRTLADERKELDAARARVEELERELNDGERATLQSEQDTKNALTERNTLLLTIYQYMGKILVGSESTSTPRKKEADVKPFTNFEVFHNSLIARLRKISDIQLSFEQRAKDLEGKLMEKFTALKRQQDSRFRQIDRFEVSIKNATDKQLQWRQRVVSKQSEVDAVKATNAELQQQLSSLRTRASLSTPGDNSKLTALTTRANNAERRLHAAQNQATQAEERLAEAKIKYGEGEGKWAARIKELELRVKAAEERVKRERQGAKERVSELTEQMRRLERELQGAHKRNKQLGEIQDAVEHIQ